MFLVCGIFYVCMHMCFCLSVHVYTISLLLHVCVCKYSDLSKPFTLHCGQTFSICILSEY